MSSVPNGWQRVLVDDVVSVIRNGVFGRRPNDDGRGDRILRISAVRDGRVKLDDSRFVEGLTSAQQSKFTCEAGDLLLTRYNGSRRLVGISGIVPPHSGQRIIHPDKLIRVVPDTSLVDPRFLNYQLASRAVRAFLEPRIRTTAGQSGISGRDVRSIPLVAPGLGEQRRIVAVLEDHLSRLDAVAEYLSAAQRRLRAMQKATLLELIPNRANYPSEWRTVTVAEAGKVELGRQRHPDWHTGPNMQPYLRVANVFEDRIDTADVKEMHWDGDTFERFRLHPGDVLLNEGQTPDLLGRPALYRGEPANVAFTNSLIRFKASPDVLPEFALLVFRRHMHAGRFKRESRITTNIAHLSAARLKPIEFPVPSLEAQTAIVQDASARLADIARLEGTISSQTARVHNLRRAVLAAAFSGKLTGRTTDSEVIEEFAG